MLQWLQVNYSNTHTPYVYTTWVNTQYGCHDRSWMHFPMCCVSLQCARVVMCCHGVIFIEVDGSACSWHSASLGVVIVSVLYFCLTPPPSSPERSCTSCSILERSLSSQIWNHQPLNQNRVSLLWSCVHMRERERTDWLMDFALLQVRWTWVLSLSRRRKVERSSESEYDLSTIIMSPLTKWIHSAFLCTLQVSSWGWVSWQCSGGPALKDSCIQESLCSEPQYGSRGLY